jgi:hypothetical protein
MSLFSSSKGSNLGPSISHLIPIYVRVRACDAAFLDLIEHVQHDRDKVNSPRSFSSMEKTRETESTGFGRKEKDETSAASLAHRTTLVWGIAVAARATIDPVSPPSPLLPPRPSSPSPYSYTDALYITARAETESLAR